MMSLNGLYDCMTQNKGKTEHLILVAKSQGASNHGMGVAFGLPAEC